MTEWLKKSSFFIVVGIFVIVFLFLTREKEQINQGDLTAVTYPEEDNDTEADNNEGEVIVDIKGEINQPGVYELDSNARIMDVVDLASGFTDEADETAVNLAQKVHDEMIIIVPAQLEDGVNADDGTVSSGTMNEKIRLNYATQEEIETLSGIGPSKAQAIIQYREENGFFQSVEDLLNISGIGEKTLEDIRDDIQIP